MASTSVWDTRRGWLLVAFRGGLATMPLVLWTPAATALCAVAGAVVLARRRAAWWWTAPAGCAVCVAAIGVAAAAWALGG